MQAVLRLYKDVDGYIRENYNMALLRREHEKGRGVILITHDMALAKETNEILLLQGGKLCPQK